MHLFSQNQIKTHRVTLEGISKWIPHKWMSILNGYLLLKGKQYFHVL